MASWLVIENKATGETYAVSAATYRQRYADQGFVVVGHEDGSDYEPPAKKADKPAQDARVAPSAPEGGQ